MGNRTAFLFLFLFVTLQQAHPRDLIPVAHTHRSPFGTQLDGYCIDVFTKKYGIPSNVVTRQFDRWIQGAARAITEHCGPLYPELKKKYLDDWVLQMKETVISCSSKTAKELLCSRELQRQGKCETVDPAGQLTGALTISNMGSDDGIWKEDIERIKTWAESSKPIRDHKPIMIFPIDSFGVSVVPQDDKGQDIARLIHEGLHLTAANNYEGPEHNALETIIKSDCSLNYLDDRITVIEHLCAEEPFLEKDDHRSASEVVFDRISQCGSERGCEQLFKKDHFPIELIPNKFHEPLDKDPAHDVCAKIYNEGLCRSKLKQDKWRRFVVNQPPLVSIARKVQDRLDAILPRFTNEIPSAMIRAYPTLVNVLSTLQSSRCFNNLLLSGPDGSLSVSPYYLQSKPLQDRWDPQIEPILNAIQKGLGDHPYCKGTPESEKIRVTFNELGQRLDLAFKSDVFRSLIRARHLNGYENNWGVTSQPEAEIPRYNALKLLIGADTDGEFLTDKYSKALSKQHFLSPQFSCASFKFSGFAAYEHLKEVERAMKENAPYCPK